MRCACAQAWGHNSLNMNKCTQNNSQMYSGVYISMSLSTNIFLTHKEIFLLLYNKKKTFHIQGKKVRTQTISYLLPQMHIFKRICNFLQICMLWPLYTSSRILKFHVNWFKKKKKNHFSFIRESSVANQLSALAPIHEHLTKHSHEHTLLLFCNVGKPCLHPFLDSLAVIYQTSVEVTQPRVPRVIHETCVRLANPSVRI